MIEFLIYIVFFTCVFRFLFAYATHLLTNIKGCDNKYGYATFEQFLKQFEEKNLERRKERYVNYNCISYTYRTDLHLTSQISVKKYIIMFDEKNMVLINPIDFFRFYIWTIKDKYQYKKKMSKKVKGLWEDN